MLGTGDKMVNTADVHPPSRHPEQQLKALTNDDLKGKYNTFLKTAYPSRRAHIQRWIHQDLTAGQL